MKKVSPILLHLGFWILFLIPSVLFIFYDQNISVHRLWHTVLSTLFTIINFYLFYSFVIPFFIKKKNTKMLVAVTILFIVVYPLIQYEIVSFLSDYFQWESRKLKHNSWFYTGTYTSTILFTGLAYFARFTARWITDQQIKNELINQNQASELALLRSQINPHFLFNTLNNIYSLVISKSDDAPTAMTKLSDIMRYMLYEANTDKVLLTKEVLYLKSYIEILQLRIVQNNFIAFNVTGDIENHFIAPMLLVPFVENAFKHCNKKSAAPGIVVHLDIDGRILTFRVKNSLKMQAENHEQMNNGGIGTKNVKRRLELLYPKKHQLLLEKREDHFYSELVINLA